MSKLVALALLVSCTQTVDAPRVHKTYDFSPRRLGEEGTTASPKGRVVAAVLASHIDQCVGKITGTIQLTIRLVVAGPHSAVDDVTVDAMGNVTVASCIADAISGMTAPAIEVPEPELWTIHLPLVVDGRYSATR